MTDDGAGEFGFVLDAISDQAKNVTSMIDKLNGELKMSKKKETEEGIKSQGLSYLDVKNILLASYNCDLINIVNTKCEGRSLLEPSSSVDRLIETRTVMERLRSIDHKLRYQVEKLVRAATVPAQDASLDPLGLRANLDNFDDENDDDESAETNGAKGGVYKAPKLAAVRYDGDETRADKKEKRAQMKAKAIANASMLKDLDLDREEPEEIFENQVHRFKEDKRLEERTKFEEENFTRITLSKKEKARTNRFANASAMGDVITNFSDSKVLWQDEDEEAGGGGGGKGKGKKRKEELGKKRKLGKGAAKKFKSKKKKRFT